MRNTCGFFYYLCADKLQITAGLGDRILTSTSPTRKRCGPCSAQHGMGHAGLHLGHRDQVRAKSDVGQQESRVLVGDAEPLSSLMALSLGVSWELAAKAPASSGEGRRWHRRGEDGEKW